MSHTLQSHTSSWRQLAPIFADVVVSPWNLLVGGVLIQSLSIGMAFASIVIGYIILALVFILYGGLGCKLRKLSSEILHETFGNSFSKYVIPVLLAAGQIGWAAVNISLGGASLAFVAHIPSWVGIVIYGALLSVMAGLNLYRLAIIKTGIVLSSISLIAYVLIAKFFSAAPLTFLSHAPETQHSLLWGVSIVVASLISFATVTPDFFRSARTGRDVVLATSYGMMLPGALTAMTGCFLFFDQSTHNLSALIATLTLPFLPNIFNILTNTDGSIALYTPALKITALTRIPFGIATGIVTALSLTLALVGIADNLTVWLSALSLMLPVFIGVAFAAVLFNEVAFDPIKRTVKNATFIVYGITTGVCIAVTIVNPSVLIALFAPIIIFAGYTQYQLLMRSHEETF